MRGRRRRTNIQQLRASIWGESLIKHGGLSTTPTKKRYVKGWLFWPHEIKGKWDKKQPVSQIPLSIDANTEREAGASCFITQQLEKRDMEI